MLFDGQVHGGIVQGAGQIMMEDVHYDPESGQLLTGSFMDYCMPRADDFCAFNIAANEIPTARNPLGVKGVGEAGTVGAMPAVMNAINNALHRVVQRLLKCQRHRKRFGMLYRLLSQQPRDEFRSASRHRPSSRFGPSARY